MRFATLSTLTVVTALSMPPVKRRRSPRLRAVAEGGGSNNGGGGVAFATSAFPFAAVPITLYPLRRAICAAHWHVPPPTPWMSIHSPGLTSPAWAWLVR